MKIKRSRPKADAISTTISFASGRMLHHACQYAMPVGDKRTRRRVRKGQVRAPFELNLFVTIRWDMTETGEDNFAALRNQRFCRWLRTRCQQLGISVPPTYVYAREQDHVHWMVHVPGALIPEFKDLVPRWITSLEHKGGRTRKRAENHKAAPPRTVKIEAVRSSIAARKYLLKGIAPEDAFRLGIKKPQPQGVVIGRRTGVSRSLGKVARDKAGYKAQWPAWRRGNAKVSSFAIGISNP